MKDIHRKVSLDSNLQISSICSIRTRSREYDIVEKPLQPKCYFFIQEVICTSRDGDHFWRMNECYVRGSTIKYLRIPDEVIDMVKEENIQRMKAAKVPF